ncbi:HIT domain-containing protein [Nocardiopsis sp. NPDC006938]|uniref:RapZ C-terminal domain-containing protein n=1 Tax=Nocardiopsis sp. NPDC006938 TaxID=3364337 RepID=UPI0036AFC3FC
MSFHPPQVEVTTLGTRHSAPPPGDALVLDLSHRLHNPTTDPALRGLTGLDPALRAHVMATPEAEETVRATVDQVLALLPHTRGPVRLHVQCRWGKHRSVAVAEEVLDRLRAKGLTASVHHRDMALPALRRADGCAFCDIAHDDQDAEVIGRWDGVLAIRPRSGGVNRGHVLFLPVDHVADATVHPETTARVMAAASAYAAEIGGDLNIITSKGENATQTVDHLHIHVVPRRRGDRLRLPWTPSWFDRLLTLLGAVRARTAPTSTRPEDQDEEPRDGCVEEPVLPLGIGGPEGWLDGLDRFGRGYTPGAVQVRTSTTPWSHTDTDTVATCPQCETTTGLSLVWPETRPDVAHLMCPWCHVAWPDHVWTGPEAIRHVLDQTLTDSSVLRADDDSAPEVAYLAEYLRRKAGNTR